jgi:hypothetical protein
VVDSLLWFMHCQTIPSTASSLDTCPDHARLPAAAGTTAATMQVLTPLQCTRLLLGSSGRSFLMDCMQLCRLVEAQWQQHWSNQLGSSTDRGHLLAASAAEALSV